MKVYVDEMPKNCFECPCFKNDLESPCGLSDGTCDYFLDEIDGGECPLHSITEHNKKFQQQLAESEKERKKAHQEGFLQKQFDKDAEIMQLEQQLADMERSKLAWENKYFKLEKQVAEKETDLSLARNEINTLKHNLNVLQEHHKVMCEKYFQKCQETNENKISFAVEKLEKVKDYFCEEDEDGDGVKTGDWTITKDACDVAEFINNQIKELEIEKILEFYINTEDKNKEPLLYVADEISSPFPNFKGKIKQTTLNKIMKDINANCKTKKEK